MEDKKHISKVFVILESIAQSKAKYIEILDNGEPVFKVKLLLDSEDMVDFLDNFFDNGFTVRQISKEDFDSFDGIETLNFDILK
jgi:hypothetical protein